MADSNFAAASAAIMNAASNYAGGKANRRLAREQLAKTIEYNKWATQEQQKENQKARDWQESMWNKNNEYNTASNQVARLRAAGLNPNLAYGELSSGNATSAGSAASGLNIPSLDQSAMTQGNSAYAHGIASAGSALAEGVMMQAQIKNIESQTNMNNAAADKSRSESGLTDVEKEIKELDLSIYNATKDVRTSMVHQEYATMKEQYNNLIESTRNLIQTRDNLSAQESFTKAQESCLPYQKYMQWCMAREYISRIAVNNAQAKLFLKELDKIGSEIDLNFTLQGFYKEQQSYIHALNRGQVMQNEIDGYSVTAQKELKYKMALADLRVQNYLSQGSEIGTFYRQEIAPVFGSIIGALGGIGGAMILKNGTLFGGAAKPNPVGFGATKSRLGF